MHMKDLSGRIENHNIGELLDKASLPDEAHQLSVSSPHATARFFASNLAQKIISNWSPMNLKVQNTRIFHERLK